MNGLKSTCHEDKPLLVKTGTVESSKVGCAIYLSGFDIIFFLKDSIFFFVDFGPISIPYPPEP